MIIRPLPLQNACLLQLPASTDARGSFVKAYHETLLAQAGIHFILKESYFSTSKKDVIRGMHFQTPPHQHAKIVFCPVGEVLDVIIDLRKDSPTYRQHYAQVLSAENHLASYIPEGFAHGFKALTDGAMTYYLVSSEWNKEHDAGIRWDSFGFDWECTQPIITDRDKGFAGLEDYNSPF